MLNAVEQQAVELRRNDWLSIEKIVKSTGLPERRVKALIKDIPKPSKVKKVVAKIPTPFAKSVDRAFTLASRAQGIRDYELRDIMHEEYGCTWNTETGKYESNYNKHNIKRLKQKVRERAAQDDCNVFFVMDWVDEENPTASRKFLEDAASDLMARIEGYVEEFMEHHASRSEDDSEEAVLARRKQRYAAEHHLLKLAVKDYGPEPLDVLLERSATLTNALEGTPDIPLSKSGAQTISGPGNAVADIPAYYPEPSRSSPFLDYVESQGWLKEVAHRLV